MVVAAVAVLVVGVAAAWLVLSALKRGLAAETARQSPDQRRRGQLAGAAVVVVLVLMFAAMIAWGPVVLLIVGGVFLVCFTAALPFVARADRRPRR